jgi:hypothetical protein
MSESEAAPAGAALVFLGAAAGALAGALAGAALLALVEAGAAALAGAALVSLAAALLFLLFFEVVAVSELAAGSLAALLSADFL